MSDPCKSKVALPFPTPAAVHIIIMWIGALCCLSACFMEFTRTLESSQRVTAAGSVAGELIVEEQIYREESFPDPRFERIYRVQSGEQEFELGRYTDEAAHGINTPPRFVADWLVVMSGAHIFFWQPEEEVRHFYPYVVDEWVVYAQERQLNGHYDYAATAVQIDSDEWRITYACTACLANHPAVIHFVSADGGQRFRLD